MAKSLRGEAHNILCTRFPRYYPDIRQVIIQGLHRYKSIFANRDLHHEAANLTV